jgi:hypothetical protein
VHLEICINSEGFKQIAMALNGLECLGLSGYMDGVFYWKKLGLKCPPFPRLIDLTITIPDDEQITSKEL